MERAAIDRRKRLNDLWTEVALIAAFQKFFDNTDPVGRKARQLRLRQIKRELHKMGEKVGGEFTEENRGYARPLLAGNPVSDEPAPTHALIPIRVRFQSSGCTFQRFGQSARLAFWHVSSPSCRNEDGNETGHWPSARLRVHWCAGLGSVFLCYFRGSSTETPFAVTLAEF